jgi:hypothetical protein
MASVRESLLFQGMPDPSAGSSRQCCIPATGGSVQSVTAHTSRRVWCGRCVSPSRSSACWATYASDRTLRSRPGLGIEQNAVWFRCRATRCRGGPRGGPQIAGACLHCRESHRHRSFEAQRGARTRFHHSESPTATATSNPPTPANHDAMSTCFLTTVTWLGRSPSAPCSWSALSAL